MGHKAETAWPEHKESYCPHCSKITEQKKIKGDLKYKCKECGNKVS
ncbi:transposase-like zinc ribbon protein [Azospirillum brasilense]|uniref:Transposase-like zinc ribbon protein n=1 Tax=Azospirillum brasilense TaxID=192 RepID=A0A560CN86_AZOBR|nr:transposase-like zinc ribbon protein [Azospirillum brasilense]